MRLTRARRQTASMDNEIRFILFAISAIFAALATLNVPSHPNFLWHPAALLFFVLVFLGDSAAAID